VIDLYSRRVVCWVMDRRMKEESPGDPGFDDGDQAQTAATRPDSPLGPRDAVHLALVPAALPRERGEDLHGPHGRLLRQRHGRELLCHPGVGETQRQ
jgi:hypothetical protein